MNVRIHYKGGNVQDIPVDTCNDKEVLQDQIDQYLNQQRKSVFTIKTYKQDQAVQLFDKNIPTVARLTQSPDVDYMECL